MKTQTGFWISHGFSIEATTVTHEELVRQLKAWTHEHKTLAGFQLDTGEEPTVQTVHFECEDC